MSYFSGLISTIFERRYQKALSNEADARTTPQLCEALLSSHGEVSGATLAHTLARPLRRHEPCGKAGILPVYDP